MVGVDRQVGPCMGQCMGWCILLLDEYHQIIKFTSITDLRKQDFLSEEKLW